MRRRPAWPLARPEPRTDGADPSELATIICAVTTGLEPPQPQLFEDLGDGPQQLLLDAIAAGELDDHLVALADAIHARRELLHTVRSAAAIAELSAGDAVRLGREVRPQYLRGELGMVVDRDDYTVTVRLLRPVGRFRSGEIRCPPLLLEKIDPSRRRPVA